MMNTKITLDRVYETNVDYLMASVNRTERSGDGRQSTDGG